MCLRYTIADGKPLDAVRVDAGSVSDKDFAATSAGKDGTIWKIEADGLSQYSTGGEVLRRLTPKGDDPVPAGVSASTRSDRLYLLERAAGWQRVRGLSWVETKEEDGKAVSTWQTGFERDIAPPDPALGLEKNPPAPCEVNLVENPLSPGKPPKLRLKAVGGENGSYLTTGDGLRLRQISERAHVGAARVVKGDTANSVTFYQHDGAAWDVFTIEGVRSMMEFDAGEIETTADGEKTHPEKAAEPPDL